MDLTSTLSKNWSVLFIRGLIAIIFGVITWFAPSASLSIMLLFFAGYFLFDGMLRTWVAWNSKQHNPYWRWLLAAAKDPYRAWSAPRKNSILPIPNPISICPSKAKN